MSVNSILSIIRQKSCRLTGLFSLVAVAFAPSLLFAQTFEDARRAAFDGERAKARQICRTILQKGADPDVSTLLGRAYAWDNQYDSARIVLQQVVSVNPTHTDALGALADVEYWDKQYEKALGYCNVVLGIDSVNEDFLYKKGNILNAKQDYVQSARTLELLLKVAPSHSDAIKLLGMVRRSLIKNRITVDYTYDYFDKPVSNREPWHLFYLQYARKTPVGTLIGRINHANRFGRSGNQFEIDAYPHLSAKSYFYLNYGYSDSPIFPDQKWGIEWYNALPKGFELSLGSRMLHFTGTKSTFIFTLSVSKQSDKYSFSIRPYFSPNSLGNSFSTYFFMRRYLSDPESYFGVRIGAGTSPDERMRLYQMNLGNSVSTNFQNRLKSQSLKLEYNRVIHYRWILNVSSTIANEESWQQTTSDTRYGINWNFESSISYLF